MARGRVYRPEEDRTIIRAFSQFTRERQRMNHFRESFPNTDRTYSSLLNRFRVLGRRRTTDPMWDSDIDTDVSDDDDDDNDDEEDEDEDESAFRANIATAAAAASSSSSNDGTPERPTRFDITKRYIDRTSDDGYLDKIEKETEGLLNHIKKRRKTLRDEADRRKREEEVKLNDTTPADCLICQDNECAHGVMVTKCGHTMCIQCATDLLTQPLSFYGQRYHKCPACRTDLGGVGALQPLPAGATKGQAYKLTKNI